MHSLYLRLGFQPLDNWPLLDLSPSWALTVPTLSLRSAFLSLDFVLWGYCCFFPEEPQHLLMGAANLLPLQTPHFLPVCILQTLSFLALSFTLLALSPSTLSYTSGILSPWTGPFFCSPGLALVPSPSFSLCPPISLLLLLGLSSSPLA